MTEFSPFALGALIVVLINLAVACRKNMELFHRVYLAAVSAFGFFLIGIGLPAFSMFIGIVAGIFSWAPFMFLVTRETVKPAQD